MFPTERLEYSAIVDRPPLKLPGGARMIVWPIVNLELWDIGRPMARQVIPAPAGASPLPDLPNWAWHEYGMRVGFWRLKAALDRFGIVPTLSINSAVCAAYPRVAKAALDGGWEFMGHALLQKPIHQELDQAGMIRASLQQLKQFTGKPPVGWLGPGLTETLETPDLLAEAGIQYIGDWVCDDEPCEIKTTHGPLVTLPYSVELNDIPMMMVQHHSAGEFVTRSMDYFDRIYAESAERAKVMAIAVHPYISGTPFRIKYFETVFERIKAQPGVLFWTGEQILNWYRGLRPRR
jgi:allantoinase